ncbi:tRNA G18 (ribose-2'-O)-methylase SpoU [Desulfocicer vacuolatum DSM 3385]|uniref:tRNA G18 (Ribose-2'-O)-methylase SpoU n=1 Tax=Desulfocicer vacuolatum DSM 3385 TaxID=1121400 RepID=A0A1W1YQC5_9BACT|nr:TrmH family RNA methyltransferase [Desulfocicer vacuolatum]SMC38001.1 tRNA G18 (ribose-2'-O)-methylase SpoU [Desulfocicer vacuolatum DSM 3385]
MTNFPFTEKKFHTLSPTGKHRWIIKWLSTFYHGLTTNRVSPAECTSIAHQYTTVRKWMGFESLDFPDVMEKREWMEFISNAIHLHRMHMGLSPRDHDLLPNVRTGDKKKESVLPAFHYHMALDGLRSLFNVGGIFRTCDAGGFQGLILGNIPKGDHPTIRKTSMGTSAWMPHCTTPDLAGELLEMKKKGFSIIGIETTENSSSHAAYAWPQKAIIVLGNEEYGISSHVLRVCDAFVHIPMLGRKNSINVVSAASVIVFHIGAFFNRPG